MKPLPPGPWTVEVSGNFTPAKQQRVTLTRDHVLALVAAAPDVTAMRAALPQSIEPNASRIWDRAVQLARTHGLLVYRGRQWVRP